MSYNFSGKLEELRKDPLNAKIRNQLAVNYALEKSNYEEAKKILDEGIEEITAKKPEDSEGLALLYGQRGSIAFQEKDYVTATECFKKSTEFDPSRNYDKYLKEIEHHEERKNK